MNDVFIKVFFEDLEKKDWMAPLTNVAKIVAKLYDIVLYWKKLYFV